ncbi:hypothetical protein BIV57_03580 [Mangrovactinospora gilvigrisea]|uniref:N-acetyltransferase domain-containing protein n=1 Tax=Mangrovactinospora gilvigrisea TaxID=1428644 RepID=A0A1J7BJN1_9ACTN|nr:hypothetical protein BIV57_03580 [Mangrovactinospora gilvigrisea]
MARAARTRLTERLRLEPAGPRSAVHLWRIHSRPEVARAYGEEPWTPAHAAGTAAAWGDAWDADGVHKWIAYSRATGRPVGRGGLSVREVAGVPGRLELGWALLPEVWGRGLATEIGAAGLDFAFRDLGAQEVVAFTDVANTRSTAVMERLGMRREGEFDDGPYRAVLYSRRRV